MFGKLFSSKPSPEVTELLKQLVPPEVGNVSEETLAEAATAKGMGVVYQALNLKLPSMGKALWDFASTATGTRYGRQVSVAIGMTEELNPSQGVFDSDKPCVVTRIEGNAPDFKVTHKDKNPETMSLPSGVAGAIIQSGGLEKDVKVSGSSEGIMVFRTRSSTDAANFPKGTIQWMSDLRLAENVANAVWPAKGK